MGGVKRFIVNAVQALDPFSYECSVLAIGALEGDSCGLKIESLFEKPVGGFDLMRAAGSLRTRIREITPDIIHIHGNNGVALLYAEAARQAGCVKRIVHSHSSSLGDRGIGKHVVDAALKKRFANAPTDCVACSKVAGDWLFGSKPYSIINNGIDLDKFVFSSEQRATMRAGLGISKEALVIGLVGAGIPVKNASFALDLLATLCGSGVNAHLILIGEGEESAMLSGRAEGLGISPYAHFTGTVTDVWRYYSAMDCLVMPSFYEGLPITLVEAQANGLPCLVSDAVSDEADVTGLLHFFSLGDASEWVLYALRIVGDTERRNASIAALSNEAVRAAGFSMDDLGFRLMEIYERKEN